MDNHAKAVELVRWLWAGRSAQVSWVSPVVATMLAAARLRPGMLPQVTFTPGSESYARSIGLLAALAGETPNVNPSGLAGLTYSPLAQLALPRDVDVANDVVQACLDTQLGGQYGATVNEVGRVIGELHDNVASHARGAGFSALQVYRDPDRVEIAVVDAGVGLLRNVRSAKVAGVDTHQAAIDWCFKKGNTTAPAGNVHPFAQRLPEDALSNPYAPTVPVRSSENHHMGEGLWQLLQLVKHLRGQLWMLTGDAQLIVNERHPQGSYQRSLLDWQGLAIEVIFPVESVFVAPPRSGDEGIAQRYRI